MAISYDINVDYMDLINKAKAAGDMKAAAQYEAQRNQKIADMNAARTNTNNYQATYEYTAKPPTQSTKVTYYNPYGTQQTGYNIGGKTYKDAGGTQRIDVGTFVNNPDGTWWLLTDKGGVQVDGPTFMSQPTMPEMLDFSKEISDLYNAIKNYQPQMLDFSKEISDLYNAIKNYQPQMPDFSKEISDLYNAIKNYQPQMPNIPYPNMKDYNFGDIQNQLNALTSQVQNYQGADYMNMDEAIARASSQLGGMYNQALEQALEQYNKNAISRGMFGQLPVEALKAQAISESELDKANAINALGANLYSQDFDMAQRENQNYYQQINKLADLLGQQYNTELGRYQSDLNRYNTLYNQARQADQDYFNNIARQLDLLETQYNMQNREIDRYVQNIGQFSNDYMAEILKLQNDNDPSNDWKIAYLQNARNQKIAGMNEAEAKSQSELYKQAMDMFSKLGYATGWIAQALGIPEGTTTATYARLNSGGSSGSSGSKSPDLNLQELTQQARLIASSMYPKGYTQTQLNDIINTLYEFWETGDTKVLDKIKNYIPSRSPDIKNYIPSRSPDTNANQYDMEIFDWLQQ